ncbi:RNA polymerase II C-terminal domain phosphatase-like 3 [Linum perenne]
MVFRQGEQTLIDTMANNDVIDGRKVGDVEEGEISDSVEEISGEDFRKQGDVVVTSARKDSKKPKKDQQDARVWTMNDLYKYQMGGGYVAGLYNLAWARAVQNKPVVEVAEDSSSAAASGSKIDKIIIDDSGDEMEEGEKEDGELEEGEIDLDCDPNSADLIAVDSSYVDSKVNLIGQALATVTVVEAEKSFKEACSKLQDTLEQLLELVQKNSVPTKNELAHLSFTALHYVSLVFCTMEGRLKEEYNEIYSRRVISYVLISAMRKCHPIIFTTEQVTEIEAMTSSSDGFSTDTVKENAVPPLDEINKLGQSNKGEDEHASAGPDGAVRYTNNLNPGVDSAFQNKPSMSFEGSKPGPSALRNRSVLLPLLDLHKDHDEDSLPSPTRETTLPLPLHRPGFPTPRLPVDSRHPGGHMYENDAFKAFSSYQQKFGRTSLVMKDSLPSPTPSEESGEGDSEIGGEVSSSSTSTLGQPSPSFLESSKAGVSMPAKYAAPTISFPTPLQKASAKSRDPRLRYVNSDTSSLDQNNHALSSTNIMRNISSVGGMPNMKKQKAAKEPIQEGPSLKRQRNGLETHGNARKLKTAIGSGGWLDDSDTFGPHVTNGNKLSENAESNSRRMDNTAPGSSIPNVSAGKEQLPVTSSSTATVAELVSTLTSTNSALLPDLLKNIAVNPTMLLNLLKIGQQQNFALGSQQNHAESAKSMPLPITPNSVPGAPPVVSSQPSWSGTSARPVGPSQVSQLTASAVQDDSLKMRMKSRDPRRALHNNAVQRTASMGSEELKASVAPTSTSIGVKEPKFVQKQDVRPEMKASSSKSLPPPDISFPFTNSLKNIASIVSDSQVSTTVLPPASQPLPVQSVQTNNNSVESNAPDERAGNASSAQVGAVAPRSQNTWSEVKHLFDGFDDKQKAAIQKERARRIAEQKKMFAANKLCLVLDLDHTLLNSAKFSEVDPVHDELLRKKEEQDREKPQKHLFRFPHMAMWTKLRPGIWNFLEKACQLFELHLYTMGNKLYATEMAKVLDPKGVLFAGRVISRGDDGDPVDGDDRAAPKSKDLEGVLGMESAVVIIDDSVRVWPHNKLNLIVVERYIYFPCSRRQFGLPGPSLLEIDHDERPEDGTLACCLGVIERIHQSFFKHESLEQADVRIILASEQRKILAGCRIVFSRIFPVGEASPHLHPLWQTAEEFGAVCTNQIDDQVTHVVANSLGTDKVNWALSNGRFVVHPGWVEASALLYRRASERDFSVKP